MSGPGRISRHLNQRVSRVTSRLDDYKVPLGLIVAVVGAFLAYVAFASTTGPPFQSRYTVEVEVPGDAPVMREGQAIRIGGKLAGLVSGVEPDRDNSGTIVTANITKPEFRPIGSDARANVRVHSIVYATYLEIYPGDPRAEALPNGGRIPQSRVTSGVDLLEVVQLFDEEARESLRETVVNIGFGEANRGDQLNEAFGDIGPAAENLGVQLEAATREPGALADGLGNASAVSVALQGNRADDVAGSIRSGSAVLETIGDRAESLQLAIELLRPFEDELIATGPLADPLLADLEAAAGELEPAVAGLNAAMPDIVRLLSLGDELRTESARISAVAIPVLRTSIPLIHDVFPTLASLNPLLPDVSQIVDAVAPYARDIKRSGTGLAEATSVRFPVGRGAGANAPMGRVITVLTCHTNRNPLPGPGEALEDSASC